MDSDLTLRSGIVVPRAALRVTFCRAGGPGGQNVNKVSTKAEVRLRLEEVPALTDEQRARVRARFPSYFTKDGELLLTSQLSRSQLQNLEDCLDRVRAIIETGIIPPKRRRPTRPTWSSQLRRVDEKRHQARHRSDRRVDAGD
ncbi:MAG: aminoacyl-tRNA hydrolase [Planctomycetes bacterium]|nr:aminoacyl-tRNA hydrolase [Planctomycetota bacterium]